MDTVTYPDPRVAQFVQDHFVPFKVNVKQDPRLAEEYHVNWTAAVYSRASPTPNSSSC